MTSLGTIQPENVRFWREPGASHPRVEISDQLCIIDARVKRLFPLSEPNKHFVLQDGEGKEVGILPNLVGLDAQSQKLVEEELNRRYFTPLIQRLLNLENQRGMWKFKVETNRGDAEFYVRNWRDSSHEMKAGRWQITSVDGQRYEIQDVDALDARSQKFLDQRL